MLRIQTLLKRIRMFDTDPDPYGFKEVMYLKQYFLYIFTWFFLSEGPTGPRQKVFFVKFSLPANFVVPLEKLVDPDPTHPGGGGADPDPEKL